MNSAWEESEIKPKQSDRKLVFVCRECDCIARCTTEIFLYIAVKRARRDSSSLFLLFSCTHLLCSSQQTSRGIIIELICDFSSSSSSSRLHFRVRRESSFTTTKRACCVLAIKESSMWSHSDNVFNAFFSRILLTCVVLHFSNVLECSFGSALVFAFYSFSSDVSKFILFYFWFLDFTFWFHFEFVIHKTLIFIYVSIYSPLSRKALSAENT